MEFHGLGRISTKTAQKKCDKPKRCDMKDLCNRLSDATGLHFRIDSDTCEPASCGAALNYWLTSYKDGFHLVANSIYDEVFAGQLPDEAELIKKINELENDYRYV